MMAENFEQMLEQSFKEREEGQIINGVIVEFLDDVVLVDIGDKQEGRLNKDEIKSENFSIGDSIEVAIVGGERTKHLSYKRVKEQRAKKAFITQHISYKDEIFSGTIVAKNKGGYKVDCDGVDIFLPRREAAVKEATAIGRNISFKIIDINEDRQSVVGSRLELIKENEVKRDKKVKMILDSKEAIKAKVKNISPRAVYFDIGECDAVVSAGQISHKGFVNPMKRFEVGESVVIQPLKYHKERRLLECSIKTLIPDPWLEVKEKLEVGDVVEVEVINIEEYGAFVDLGNDVEGFLHISEMSWDKGRKSPEDYVKVGDRKEVEIVNVDLENKKLRVSLKTLQESPFESFIKSHKENEIVKAKVISVKGFGAFLNIDGMDGLLRNQDISWDKEKKCEDVLKIGDEVEVKITSIDQAKESILLSKKALEPGPIEKFTQKHKAGDIITGRLKHKASFGVFVELYKNVDALILNDDLRPLDKETLEMGSSVEAVIVFIDEKNSKIRVSVSRLNKQREQESIKNAVGELNKLNSLAEKLKSLK